MNIAMIHKNEGHGDEPQGMNLTWDSAVKWDAKKRHDSTRAATVLYPLTLDGEKTDYWLKTRVYTTIPSIAYGECEVVQGKPGTPGSEQPILIKRVVSPGQDHKELGRLPDRNLRRPSRVVRKIGSERAIRQRQPLHRRDRTRRLRQRLQADGEVEMAIESAALAEAA